MTSIKSWSKGPIKTYEKIFNDSKVLQLAPSSSLSDGNCFWTMCCIERSALT